MMLYTRGLALPLAVPMLLFLPLRLSGCRCPARSRPMQKAIGACYNRAFGKREACSRKARHASSVTEAVEGRVWKDTAGGAPLATVR